MILRSLSRLLVPPLCVTCGAEGCEPFCAVCARATLPAADFSLAGFDDARALFAFGGSIELALHLFKDGGREDVGRALGRCLGPWIGKDEVLLPVPGEPNRTRKRGFNPPSVLARASGARVEWGLLSRRAGPPQRGLGRHQRLTNVAGVFESRPEIHGRSFVVLDDVVTTGATVDEVARVLRAGGARCRLLALAHVED
ncbi:MAG: ComF family protein [Myxococcota bacterium]